ncbi:cell division protein ZapA [Cytobacillus solani]|uniref:Cell division protein ZapA n=1 Tax=Cytobacillus solani TaxID=1637975 RepID=A0A0Q3SR24_9BACI|nr:cell division protein ZapA [Cytobacillus solani]KOP84062.1 cell division protein ZapA [Bacillus sp. FJAT-21945]KQL22004.1 cell division protein ZapA [Cytobacillus solani]USK53979.1 cell division protein ZapA [Cytobacillus solani]
MSDVQKNRTSVDIYGTQYIILGTESPGHIRLVASMVDEKMREISSKNPSLDSSKLAVLTAVNIVNDYIKAKDRLEQLENELKRVKD